MHSEPTDNNEKGKRMTPTVSEYKSDIASRYFKDAMRCKKLSSEEIREQIGLAQSGDEDARQRVIEANLFLVVTIVNDLRSLRMPFLDAINEGNLALMEAVRKFDLTRGTKWSPYAGKAIRNRIRSQSARQSKDFLIRIPIGSLKDADIVNRSKEELSEKLGREATDVEVSDDLQKPVSYVRRKMMTKVLNPVYIDDRDEDGFGFDLESHPEKNISERRQLLADAMKCLDKREKKIILRRFGLGILDVATLEVLSQEFGLTRERIRQVEAIALNKMKKSLNKLGLDSAEVLK
jgi:RNA polymerase primary sigma factor